MAANCLVFVGSLNREAPYFQGARGVGLSVYSLDEETRETKERAETGAIDNPTFLSVSEDGSRVYANSEVFGWHEGLVSAFRFDRRTNTLDYINKQPTLGSVAAHNFLSRDGRKLLVANYGMGDGGPDRSVVVFGIRDDGGLTPPLSSVAHRGTGPNADRQERSHAHSVNETVDGGILVVADLGIDRLVTYRLAETGDLELLSEFAMAPGAGPRHVALHPGGRFLFVMNELDSTVASLSLDPASGNLALIDTLPAVPAEARAHNHCADIQISPTDVSSTAPTAGTTASPSSLSIRTPDRCRSSTTLPVAVRPHATSRSPRRGTICSQPTRTPTSSPSSRATPPLDA